ncbi:hypothetical protein [Gryllotalpicola ginsengisoli]|uniref:hypothetical protein n=1 Tax=Gryllotalpicola ginsengisoli TaxID=444608 RepID=UPI0003FD3520|nr:hypothetical protein [Gryllotalpicola ginsengisoli]
MAGLIGFWRRLPWWARVTAVFAGGRTIDTALLLWMAAIEGRNAWTAAHPGYFAFANIWDGRWYQIIASAYSRALPFGNYPVTLPYDTAGHVQQNAWAFLPGYPYVVKGMMLLTRLPWEQSAVIVSLLCAWGATLVFYKLMRLRLRPSTAMYATVLFSVAPVAALFQVAYAEAMYGFLLALILYLLLRRRYWLMLPVIVVAAFTRPSGLAVALTLGLHVLWRLWARWRRGDEYRMPQLVASVVAVLVALVSGVAWPLIAARVTGVPDAYTATELSWRAAYTGWGGLVPFASWIDGAKWWFTLWLGLPAWVGYVALAALVALFALLLLSPAARRLGVDLRLWSASYALYVLAVFFPQSSTFRILFPLFPMLGILAQPRSRWYRVGMVVASIAAQLGWLLLCWTIGDYDWSPP